MATVFSSAYRLSVSRAQNALRDVATSLDREIKRMTALGRHDDANALCEAWRHVDETRNSIGEVE